MFIKLSLNSTTRKIKIADQATLSDVQKEIIKIFGEKATPMSLCYLDSESELITISSEEDWQICVEETKEANKGKPILSISLKLVQADDFVAVNDSKLDTVEPSVLEETEIKQEPIELKTETESFPDNKVIQEVKPEETMEESKHEDILEEQLYDPEEFMDTEITIPVEAYTQPGDIAQLAENMRATISSLLGIPVDIMQARVEQTEESEEEEEKMDDSRMSTLTSEQKTEIEDLIEQKVSKILSLKKEKKAAKKDDKKKKEKKAEKKVEKKEAASKKDFVHWNITCDGCKKGIRNMARFKSLVIQDFDLCEECEKTGMHPGPMVKYSTPSNYNPGQLNMKFAQFRNEFEADAEKRDTEPETCEGFRMPPHHPFHGAQRMCHIRPMSARDSFCGRHNKPNWGRFHKHQEPIIKPFAGIVNGIFEQLSKAFQEPKPEATEVNKPKTQEQKPADKKEEVAKSFDLAREFISEFPQYAGNELFIVSIIDENCFTSMDQIADYLL